MTLKQDLAIAPVYPTTEAHGVNTPMWGITLRQHYAGLAMQGLLANHGDTERYETIARWSAEYADALIAELSK